MTIILIFMLIVFYALVALYNKKNNLSIQHNMTQPEYIVPPTLLNEPLQQYDMNKAYHPLENPTKRPDRSEIAPIEIAQYLDYPTHGYTDTFQVLGILLKDPDNKFDPNRILRLYGRQTYPRSNQYDYYTMVQSGNDNIKIALDNIKKELYEGDNVFIKELNSKYKVQINKTEPIRYNPYRI